MEKFRALHCKRQPTNATPDQHIDAHANCHLDRYPHRYRYIAAHHYPDSDRDADPHRNADSQAIRYSRPNCDVLAAESRQHSFGLWGYGYIATWPFGAASATAI